MNEESSYRKNLIVMRLEYAHSVAYLNAKDTIEDQNMRMYII